MYKCLNCNKYFQNKKRKTNFNSELLNQYIWERQTYKNLAKKHNRSKKWIQKKLDEVEVKNIIKLKPRSLVVVADTTFFSRTKGLTVFREPNLHQNIWWKFVDYERALTYEIGKKYLEQNGFTIKAVVLDGKRGIKEVFGDIPVQMCHFHQKKILIRYLTSRPKLEASIELKRITTTLTKTNEKRFTDNLNEWNEKWREFLKEKTINPETGRWNFTHKRLCSAIRSLKTNLPYLFTYQRYPELHIPNTTNSLDGYFGSLKNKLNVHRGLSLKRRKRVVIELLKGEE